MTVLRSPNDGSPISTDMRKLMQRLIDTGGQSVGIRFGTSSLAMVAQVNNNAGLQTHGLGRTPIAVLANGTDNAGFVNVTIRALTATQFAYSLAYVDGTARTATETIYWVAVG